MVTGKRLNTAVTKYHINMNALIDKIDMAGYLNWPFTIKPPQKNSAKTTG